MTEQTPAPAPAAEQNEELPRRLGAFALFLIVVAFNAPIAAMAGFIQLAIGFGNGLGAPIAFLVAGGLLLVFSVGFVNMSRYIRHPGAFYRFITQGLGRAPGLAGAFLATVAYILLAAGSYVYMGLIALDLANRLTGSPLLPWQIWTLIFVAVITVLGLLRIDLSIKVLGTLVCLEIVVVAVWQLAVALRGGPEGYAASTLAPSSFFTGSVGLGVLFAMLTMIGIETAACFRDETRNPETSVGKATYGAIGFLAVFYAIGTWAYIVTQGASRVVESATTDPVGSFLTSMQNYVGTLFLNIVSVILVTSQMAAINAIQGAASRYLYSLGRCRVLWKGLARVHRRLESPHVAVLTVTAVSLVILACVFAFRLDAVLAYGSLTGMGIYFLLPLLIATSVAVVVFYRRNPELSPGAWPAVAAPVLALIGLAVLFVLTTADISVLVPSPPIGIAAEVGLVVIAVAGVVLALRYRRTRPEVYQRIGEE